MTDQNIVIQFVNNIKRILYTDWDKKAATQRVRLMHAAVTAVLPPCGVPTPSLELLGSLGGNAYFIFSKWNIQLDPNSYGSDIISKAQFIELVCTAYHETRHCEQWFLMARYASQDSFVRVGDKLGIPILIAHEAFKKKMGLNDPMLPLAKTWYESVYGGGSSLRGITLGALSLRKTGKPHMHAFHNGVYQRYSGGLPEETDAWAIENLVSARLNHML